jgi:hypothetical protein
MIFGNRGRIAIETEIDTNSTEWCFGRVCLWAQGTQIGDFSQTVILTVTVGFFEDFLQHTGQRHAPELEHLPVHLLISLLYDALFGDSALTLHEAAQLGKLFRKYCVCPGGGEAFDGWLAFYIEGRYSSRFMWLNSMDEQEGEVELEPGEFEAVIQAFIAWTTERSRGSASK